MSLSLSTVFCDDTRIENNGKLILIGVYQEDLIPAFLPQTIPISIWARLSGLDVGDYDISVKVGVGTAVQHDLKVKLSVQHSGKPAHIHLVGVPIHVSSPSFMFVEVNGIAEQPELKSLLEVKPVPAQGDQQA